ncbi:MAG: disulfide bond formation protein B [Alphaproteobacteria bacterium GM202ARS2]|nr:disulfide bond formation protein B [Alphaproteobacteria bacterium GM202ARS2]
MTPSITHITPHVIPHVIPPADMRTLSGIGVLIVLYVFFSEHVLGHAPCPLCWQQRYLWFAIIPLAYLGFVYKVLCLRLIVVGLLATSFAIATYHSGIEYGLWQGPDTCSGIPSSSSLEQLRQQLYAQPIVRCDEVTWTFLGLSMATYNALLSLCAAIGITLNTVRS